MSSSVVGRSDGPKSLLPSCVPVCHYFIVTLVIWSSHDCHTMSHDRHMTTNCTITNHCDTLTITAVLSFSLCIPDLSACNQDLYSTTIIMVMWLYITYTGMLISPMHKRLVHKQYYNVIYIPMMYIKSTIVQLPVKLAPKSTFNFHKINKMV